MILIASVKHFSGYSLIRFREQLNVQVDHVLNMDVRAHLRAAEYRDLPVVDGMVRQDVYSKIKTLASRIATNGCRTYYHCGEIRGLVIQKNRFA